MNDDAIVALVEAAKVEILERMEKTETTLLKEFRKWAVRLESAMKIEATKVSTLMDRIEVVEERLDDLEDKH
jgi:hypothetical protein